MKMNDLDKFDIPGEIIDLWRANESDLLLPLQESAVRRYGLFGELNLLIQAPTSSGKTFIGEMAAIQAALRRKRVVFLVPLKALAEEKYLDFREKYSPYGLKVIVSTRDRREFDRDLEHGSFSIAVAVYEKLSQLLVRRPEWLEEVALAISDELEILSDPDRGPAVEVLLTRILRSKTRPGGTRLIGLSAVIGNAPRLAEWMGATLVSCERRPVELRYGVLHEGVFRYRTFNEVSEGEEPLVNAHSESTWETLTENVRAFAEGGETCLIFVKARHEARRGAELLSRRINAPPATAASGALRDLEPTRSRDCLLETLNTGIAFHNADLCPQERRVVEQGFRNGEIRVLVSTSTLAMGMNLPARNVFMAAEKWRYDNRIGMPWKTPILRSEYENMGGRAGRFGVGHEFGRSILVAATPFDYETLRRRYVEGHCEPVEPHLAAGAALENHVLGLVASRCCSTDEELLEFLENTLSGRWVWQESLTLDESRFRIRAAVNRAVDAGVIVRHPDGRLESTPLGLAAASKGVTIATARDLEHWLAESETRIWNDLDLIFAAASTPDGRMVQIGLTAQEYEHAGYVAKLKQATAGEDIGADTPLNRIRNCNLAPFFEEVRGIKAALFLNEWIDHVPVCEIEENYQTTSGQILAASEQVSWLIDSAGALAAAAGGNESFVERMHQLAERVQRGVRAEALPVARLDLPGITRAALAALVTRGLHTPEAVAGASEEDVAAALRPHLARPCAGEDAAAGTPAPQQADRVGSDSVGSRSRATAEPEDTPATTTARSRGSATPPHATPPLASAGETSAPQCAELLARRLAEWSAACLKGEPQAYPLQVAPVLVVDDRRPGEVLIDGVKVRLQEKQYRLIRVLSALPGECIPYETIYKMVWGSNIVEANQMHFQKRKLLECIRQVLPQRAELITTVPKRGFVLNLAPSEVALRSTAATGTIAA